MPQPSFIFSIQRIALTLEKLILSLDARQLRASVSCYEVGHRAAILFLCRHVVGMIVFVHFDFLLFG